MVERAAFLSQTHVDLNRPSIFELVAQEGLQSALRSSLKFALRVCANHFPEKFGPLYRRSNEVQLLLDFLIQRHYLNSYGASFAETFYNLQRVGRGDKLSVLDLYKSLLSLTLIPYFSSKLEEKLTAGDILDTRSGLLYRYFQFAWDMLTLVQWILYIWQFTKSHSPLLQVLGLRLVNSSSEEDSTFSLTKLVEMCAFFVQFLDWWFSSQTGQARSILSLPVPKAPHGTAAASPRKGYCPLCDHPWSNECVLRISGYVFCYRCISQHLKEDPRCPVTKLPADANDLIRIYSTED